MFIHAKKRPQNQDRHPLASKRRRLDHTDATLQSRSIPVVSVLPSVPASDPVSWPLSEAYSQRDLLRELRPRRQPKARASTFYKRLHMFSNRVSD